MALGKFNTALPRHVFSRIPFLLLCVSLKACFLAPEGYQAELQNLHEQGKPYNLTYRERNVPELSARPNWKEVLQRALLTNGELEAAYYGWLQALEEVGISSTYPNANLSLGYDYIFSGENLKTFDRMMFSLAFDSTQHLSYPPKVTTAGRIALAQAQAAGERFRAKKLALQTKVLTTWAEYSLLNEQRILLQENLSLLRTSSRVALARIRSTAEQAEMIRNNVALSNAENRIHAIEAELERVRAVLNGLLSRNPRAELQPPDEIEAREIPSDLSLITAGVSQNPELKALRRELEAAVNGVRAAKLQWFPDISPSLSVSGSISQSLGAMLVLPSTVPAVQARIRQAQAGYFETQARLRQNEYNRAAAFSATLIALRNSQRQERLFNEEIIPQSELLVRTRRSEYTHTTRSYLELIEAEETLLEARLASINARADVVKSLAELEQLLGVDIETLNVGTRWSGE